MVLNLYILKHFSFYEIKKVLIIFNKNFIYLYFILQKLIYYSNYAIKHINQLIHNYYNLSISLTHNCATYT